MQALEAPFDDLEVFPYEPWKKGRLFVPLFLKNKLLHVQANISCLRPCGGFGTFDTRLECEFVKDVHLAIFGLDVLPKKALVRPARPPFTSPFKDRRGAWSFGAGPEVAVRKRVGSIPKRSCGPKEYYTVSISQKWYTFRDI